MYAVWKYDGFPYILTGKVIGDIDDDGFVEVDGYDTMRFKPIKLISVSNGKKLQAKIDELRTRERNLLSELRTTAYAEIIKIVGV